jgi:hypothetical protein
MSKLSIGTKVVVEGHIGRETWHLSNLSSNKGYQGRIVAYDETGDYLVEIVVKGKTRKQKVKA